MGFSKWVAPESWDPLAKNSPKYWGFRQNFAWKRAKVAKKGCFWAFFFGADSAKNTVRSVFFFELRWIYRTFGIFFRITYTLNFLQNTVRSVFFHDFRPLFFGGNNVLLLASTCRQFQSLSPTALKSAIRTVTICRSAARNYEICLFFGQKNSTKKIPNTRGESGSQLSGATHELGLFLASYLCSCQSKLVSVTGSWNDIFDQ